MYNDLQLLHIMTQNCCHEFLDFLVEHDKAVCVTSGMFIMGCVHA